MDICLLTVVEECMFRDVNGPNSARAHQDTYVSEAQKIMVQAKNVPDPTRPGF